MTISSRPAAAFANVCVNSAGNTPYRRGHMVGASMKYRRACSSAARSTFPSRVACTLDAASG
ncbi:hypothetical protein ABGB18_01900 [Nonomuraea sp. B12E4]|uniref:hypothetical protein n=1 Tax=Nonomuraea sp. B12E4 TaxID=3153564 RepID=UPI00325DA110